MELVVQAVAWQWENVRTPMGTTFEKKKLTDNMRK